MALTKVPDSLLRTAHRKNIIINGEMRISQRATSVAAAPSGYNTVDRFTMFYSGGITAVVTDSQAGATNLPFGNARQVNVTTADAAIPSTDNFRFTYRVEGFDARAFMFGTDYAKTITLSFWHRYTKTGTYCMAFRNNGNDRSYVAEYTHSVSDSWEQTEITIPGDTTGTWLLDNDEGLEINFMYAAGTTFHTAADVWTAGSFLSTSNQVNALDAINNNMRISLVQLEVGSEATGFEHRSYGEDLALCQRYFIRLGEKIGTGYCADAGGTSILVLAPTPVPMRTAPSPSVSGGATNTRCRGNGQNLTPSAFAVDGLNEGSQVLLDFTVTTAVQYEVYTGLAIIGMELDAEL